MMTRDDDDESPSRRPAGRPGDDFFTFSCSMRWPAARIPECQINFHEYFTNTTTRIQCQTHLTRDRDSDTRIRRVKVRKSQGNVLLEETDVCKNNSWIELLTSSLSCRVPAPERTLVIVDSSPSAECKTINNCWRQITGKVDKVSSQTCLSLSKEKSTKIKRYG
jgi:hypothetical protein